MSNPEEFQSVDMMGHLADSLVMKLVFGKTFIFYSCEFLHKIFGCWLEKMYNNQEKWYLTPQQANLTFDSI